MYSTNLTPAARAIYSNAPTSVKNVVWAMLEEDFLIGLDEGDYQAQSHVETCLEDFSQSETMDKSKRMNSIQWLNKYRTDETWAKAVNDTMDALVLEIYREKNSMFE